MRVYLPSTLPALAAALRDGQLSPAAGYAVTPALREWYASGDLEELEYVALTEAARASLRLLAADPGAPARRVVLAGEVPDGQVGQPGQPSDHDHPATVRVLAPVPLDAVKAGYIDAPDAMTDVRAAVAALRAADDGDDDARFTVDGAEGHELLWYATQELGRLLG